MRIKVESLFSGGLVDPFVWKDDYDGGTSVHYCIKNNKLPLLKKILSNEPKINSLLGQRLINTVNKGGVSPIQEAVLMNKPNFVNYLLSQRCDTSLVDLEGKGLYHYVVLANYQNLEIVPQSSFILCSIL